VRRAALTFSFFLLLAAFVSTELAAAGGPSLGKVRSRLEQERGKLRLKQGRARVLTTDIAGFDRRIGRVQGRITVLEGRLAGIQADLDAKRGELLRIRGDLRHAHARLARLRLELFRGRRILARRLVELYEADHPDLVTVVLSARGFADLLESGQFLSRVGEQDRRVIVAVRTAKAATTETVGRLNRLETRQRRLTVAVLVRRNQVGAVRGQLVAERGRYADARAARSRALGSVNAEARKVRSHIDFLQGEAVAIERRIQAAQRGPAALPAGPIRGGGTFIWPVNGPITSPFCERRAWEACHPGIDIGVGAGTPIRAAGSGRVIIAGPNGGYGNYTCIQHPGPLSTCYAHQSSIGVHVGQAVSQGQVIGLVGCTGLCFGAHLHFEVRVNGSVVNPLGYL
jgi:murein DD-endopeptidase MepM/ murein hydrolase activator NlpD